MKLLAFIFSALLLIAAVGCQTHVRGGASQHTTGGFHAVISTPSGPVEINDDRESIATTQPSIDTNANAVPSTTAAKEGELGGVSWKVLPKPGTQNIIVGLLLVAGGVVLFIWIPNGKTAGVILAGTGLVALFAPWLLVVALAGGGIAGVVYVFRNTTFAKQVVGSVEHAMTSIQNPEIVADLKGYMAERQDESVKKTVSEVKP